MLTGLLLRVVASVAVFLAGFGACWKIRDWRDGASQTKAAVHAVVVVQKQSAVSQVAAVQQQRAQDHIIYVHDAIAKEIPLVLTPEVDRAFPLSVGLVRVYDASILGRQLSSLAPPAGQSDASASAVTDSAAGAVFNANGAECLADRATLTGVLAWAKDEGLTDPAVKQ